MEGLVFAVLIYNMQNWIFEKWYSWIECTPINNNPVTKWKYYWQGTNIKFIDKDSILEINHAKACKDISFLQPATR